MTANDLTHDQLPRRDNGRVVLLASTLTARGLAMDLSGRVRHHSGIPLTGAELESAVAGWLRDQDIDPDTGRWTHEGWWPGLPAWALERPAGATPPAGLLLHERHAWACRWALTVQAQTIGPLPDVVFAGTPAAGGGPGIVTVCSGGTVAAVLANTGYRSSPSGFGWGFAGSGAAALARSILTAALGGAAACPACLGSGKVTWLHTGAGYPVPWQPAHDDLTGQHDDEDTEDPYAIVDSCGECGGDGIGIPGPVYQEYKFNVIGKLAGDLPFVLTRAGQLAWLEHQKVDARLAVTAAGMLAR